MGDVYHDYTAPASAFSESTAEHRITCPTGMKYVLLSGYVTRDANQTLVVSIFNSSNQEVVLLDSQAAGTNTKIQPNGAAYNRTGGDSIEMTGGDYIKILFGGAQGAGAVISFSFRREPL